MSLLTLLGLSALALTALLAFWIGSEHGQMYAKLTRCLKLHTEAYCMNLRIDHGKWFFIRALIMLMIFGCLHLPGLGIQEGVGWVFIGRYLTALFGFWPLLFDSIFNAAADIPYNHLGKTAWSDRAYWTVFGKHAFWASRIVYLSVALTYFLF
jgi:hypothetical protein